MTNEVLLTKESPARYIEEMCRHGAVGRSAALRKVSRYPLI